MEVIGVASVLKEANNFFECIKVVREDIEKLISVGKRTETGIFYEENTEKFEKTMYIRNKGNGVYYISKKIIKNRKFNLLGQEYEIAFFMGKDGRWIGVIYYDESKEAKFELLGDYGDEKIVLNGHVLPKYDVSK